MFKFNQDIWTVFLCSRHYLDVAKRFNPNLLQGPVAFIEPFQSLYIVWDAVEAFTDQNFSLFEVDNLMVHIFRSSAGVLVRQES